MNERIQKACSQVKDLKVDALLVTNPVNIFYLTGCKVSTGAVLVFPKGIELYLDQRYIDMAHKRSKTLFTLFDISNVNSRISLCKKVGFEADTVSVEQYETWKSKFKNTKFIQTIDLIKGLRRYKDDSEIFKIKKASSITKSVLRRVPRLLKVGMTEIELATLLESECRKRGAEGMAFETIVGFGVHTSIPHHRPTSSRLRHGDIVQIDMGAKFDGYCSDFSRVFFTGSIGPDEKKALRALKRAKKVSENNLSPGISLHTLDAIARESLKKDGYTTEFCHALGHGVGIEIHEGVTISSKRPDVALKSRDVMTIEPGLYFPGKFGMRIEDTHIVL